MLALFTLFFSSLAGLWGILSSRDPSSLDEFASRARFISFFLRQDHATDINGGDPRLNIENREDGVSIVLSAVPTTVYRQRTPAAKRTDIDEVEWYPVEVLAPNIEDRQTLLELAKMTGNAYALPGQKNWYEMDEFWNASFPFGWEDKADGFRGHVFASPDNSTVVLSIKGTTLQGPTSKKDKFNDNLLFSCCCARVDFTWMFATVCDCYTKNWKCDNTCLSEALIQDSLFYSIGVNLVNNLTMMYPTSNIWLTGHSLGGSLAALLGSTFGLPAVAIEAPGEKMAAHRLHLPLPPVSPITHLYHTADPIPQGVCNGFGSPCAAAGYALETRCHLGKSIVYDTVSEYGWRVDVQRHRVREMIVTVLADEREWEEGRNVPEAKAEEDCVDCYKWEFGGFKDVSYSTEV